MKISEENYNIVPKKEQIILKALLSDLEFINNHSCNKIFINWIDHHTEYSPEWTDPCPDFYGTYSLIRSTTKDRLGVEMDLDTLDIALCLLNNYIIYE